MKIKYAGNPVKGSKNKWNKTILIEMDMKMIKASGIHFFVINESPQMIFTIANNGTK